MKFQKASNSLFKSERDKTKIRAKDSFNSQQVPPNIKKHFENGFGKS